MSCQAKLQWQCSKTNQATLTLAVGSSHRSQPKLVRILKNENKIEKYFYLLQAFSNHLFIPSDMKLMSSLSKGATFRKEMRGKSCEILLITCLSQSVWVAITKYQRLGCLHNKHFFFFLIKVQEVRKYKIKIFILMPYANTFNSDNPFPDLQMTSHLPALYSHSRENISIIFLSYKGTNLIHEDFTHMTSHLQVASAWN